MSRDAMVIYETEELRMFYPTKPVTVGQVTIETKEPFNNIKDLPSPLLSAVLMLAQCYVRTIKNQLKIEGYSLLQNGGSFSASENFQLYIIPRENKDSFGWIYADEVDNAAKEFEHLKNLLSAQFKKDFS